MPKDTSTPPSAPFAPPSELVGVPIPPVLKRNNACLACRKRKLRCSADRPACATCLRSHNHIMRHIKPGQIAPPLDCVYEDLSALPPPALRPKAGKKVDRLETRVQQLEGLLRQVVGNGVVESVGNGASWNGNAQGGPSNSLPSPSPGPLFSPSIFPPSGYSPGPTFHHESPTAGLDLLASSFDHLDQHVEQQPLPPPTPTGFPLPPLLSHAPQPASDLVSESSSPSSRLSSRSGSGSSQHQTPNIGSPSFQSTLKFDAPRPLSRKYNTFPPSEPSPSSFGPSAIQSAAQSNLRESITGVEATSDDERLLELLWPGWPPHLPSPGFLMHVVEIYFTSVPMSHYLLDRSRFITRLALPPTHDLFPHPAVLHSICAISARYTSLPLNSPADVIRDAPLSKKARSHRSRLDEGSKPTKDGLSAPLPGEPDFGGIHAQWTKIYIEQSLKNPEEWLDLTLAATLLAGYMHQHACWVESWTWIGQATRLAIPLGLNTFQTSSSEQRSANRLYLIPPTDPTDTVDRVQRTNLWWMLYAHDTFASTTSGWAPSIPVPDMTIGLPLYAASHIPSTIEEPSQNSFTLDLFTRHPIAHRSVSSLMMKSAMLVRKVNDLLRKLESMGCEDYRQQLEFQQLDSVITSFQQSFPPEFRDLSPATLGDQSVQGVNPELFHTHCLPWLAIVCLHSSSADVTDPYCPSSIRVREATSALLNHLWIISNSNFDFSLLHPFQVFTWFTAAKSLLPFAEEARSRADFGRAASLRSEVDVFRSAILIIGQKLPIGLRTAKMLDQLIEITDKQENASTRPAPPKSLVSKVPPTWIGADLIDKVLES